ncbi:hypothetical protein TUM3794_30380 [Shewanella colwelliana]|nr:hypothetical protein TUM3794_30380 [Shewanella colwelliana]
MKDLNRRNFLKVAGLTAAGLVTTKMSYAAQSQQAAPPLGKSVMGLVAPKLDTVRVGFIGVGERGYGHVQHFCHLEGVEIKAICDTHQEVL